MVSESFGIQIRRVLTWTLVVVCVVNNFDREGVCGVFGLWTVGAKELVGVVAAVGLVQVVVNCNAILVASLSGVVNGAIDGSKTVDCNEAGITGSSDRGGLVTRCLEEVSVVVMN